MLRQRSEWHLSLGRKRRGKTISPRNSDSCRPHPPKKCLLWQDCRNWKAYFGGLDGSKDPRR